MDDQRWSMPNRRIRPPPPPPPPHLTQAPPPLPPWTQGLEDLKFGGSQEILQETGTTKNCPRARWNHKMKSYLIELLKEHDTPRYRTQNAWSKEAWKSIVDAFNLKFGLSFASAQVKQKEQDMKKDFKVIKDLLSESGFGWDPDRMMVVAPDDVWAGLRARKNKDALQWQDKSFPYYDDLFALYDGRYAQGRSCRGMDLYAKKAAQPSQASASYSQHLQDPEENLHSPTPYLPAPGGSSMHFGLEEEIGSTNWFSSNDPLDQATANSPPSNDCVGHALLPDAVPRPACSNEAPHNSMEHPENVRKTHQQSNSAPKLTNARQVKKQKTRNGNDDFHERYLSLRREEIDRLVAIEERKAEDPYSIQKCITTLEGLKDLQIGDILKAADLFTDNKNNREIHMFHLQAGTSHATSEPKPGKSLSPYGNVFGIRPHGR